MTFTQKVIEKLKKTNQEILEETVQHFAENAAIEIEVQIANVNGELSKRKVALKKAEKQAETAKEQFENAKYSIASNFETYINSLNVVKDNIEIANEKVALINADILFLEKELAAWNDLAQIFV